ncbi:hypothetical protein JI435_304860 [Parastagonospora nodorum SN15]|uniref:Uncharacterized protein n=1 Tax=Phaeosphaeria nodorum (strain SN15 / ATCC MYA-4574 / FGSC 10173) TaxID=321614 RepID=A0A7U2F703_PHANO|nr:hypothetical protein HBH53_048520 [Parastagonospora nodorum]QRC99909.1 hypothetical protein JI435_304860 [Parastagonospora nodorum SN15]KAH3979552.1 hypothetical protein HBH51_059530 [Parastagonospora nodorum]KAH3980121.1 hypothetical protein HBH52_095670 [Parastagonospora nodorum]KAH4126146.1 hypothetical protein HBH47_058720 [Parastagonospora nodorum]
MDKGSHTGENTACYLETVLTLAICPLVSPSQALCRSLANQRRGVLESTQSHTESSSLQIVGC